MLIYDLHTDINMILNTDTWPNTKIWLRHGDIDLLQADINMIINTNFWFNTIWYLI